jgi:hypothetical protein
LARDFINAIYENPALADFSQNYFGFGVIDQLVDWPVIATLMLGVFLVDKLSWHEWFRPFILFVLQFLSALLIPIIYRPFYNTIADPALSLTVLLLALLIGGVYYGLYRLEQHGANLKLFKVGYFSVMLLLPVLILRTVWGYYPLKPSDKLFTAEVQFYSQPVDQVFPTYKGFNIILYRQRYYGLANLGQVDVTDKNAFQQCQSRNECLVGNSLKEVRASIDFLTPELVETNYKGFYLVAYQDKFYALSQTLGEPPAQSSLVSTLLHNEDFLETCQARSQCGIGRSMVEIKQLVDLLTTQTQ